jgi:uncharacterized protein (DUF1697 family)
MARHAAFLRGVNLARHRRVTGATLRACFERMGFSDVGPFRTSGNVAFDGGRASEATLKRRIERGLAEELGFEVAVFLRSADQLRAIASFEPFPRGAVEASNGKLQVTLLERTPSSAARKSVLAMATAADPLVFGERELYWLPSGGLLESELDLAAIEKLIGPTTRRTMGTVQQMAAKHF